MLESKQNVNIVRPADSKEEYRPANNKTFLDELTGLINRHSVENISNTPDFVLSQYIDGCLRAFQTAVQQRENWHGRDPRPTHTRYGRELNG